MIKAFAIRFYFVVLLCGYSFCCIAKEGFGNTIADFNSGWLFRKLPSERSKNSNLVWQRVNLPHSAEITAIPAYKHWQGRCEYKKQFYALNSWRGKEVSVEFGAGMQVAEVAVNGIIAKKHYGGYLPFRVTLSKYLRYGQRNEITIILDNSDNAEVPPGKALADLDFCYYSGLYRSVTLNVTDQVFFDTDVSEPSDTLGGFLIAWKDVTRKTPSLLLEIPIHNTSSNADNVRLEVFLSDKTGQRVIRVLRDSFSIPALGEIRRKIWTGIEGLGLWSPDAPNLYTLHFLLQTKSGRRDSVSIQTGVREFTISDRGELLLNSVPLELVGTNRHQEYPFVGNAVPANAQYRDAVKIREAGLNFVRLSHYPQDPSFLDACDELGLVVMNSIPGWQFSGNHVFKKRVVENANVMIRRDRNHPSIALWELSLNETEMPDSLINALLSTAKKLNADIPLLTAGWLDKPGFDVFIPARQHAAYPDYWNNYQGKPILISEYGDWEYYAQNAGFNQRSFSDLKPADRSSRQLREYGEKKQLQQAFNFQEALNSNRKTAKMGHAFWLMFDYSRGYANDLEASGVMDVFRLPKLSYYFFQSQRDPFFISKKFGSGPMVKIAALDAAQPRDIVKVFSNCDSVVLLQGERHLSPMVNLENSERSDRLKSPPYIFKIDSLCKCEITAKGYLKGEMVSSDRLSFPGKPYKIRIWMDISGRDPKAGNDLIFIHAEAVDRNNTIIPGFEGKVDFSIVSAPSTDYELLHKDEVRFKAGIASTILKTGKSKGMIVIKAASDKLEDGSFSIKIKQ